jgi:hypothetical protein
MLQTLEYLSATNKPRYHFALSGGEVTLYPHLEEMLRAISGLFRDKQCGVNLLSNGSASVETMRSLLRAAAPHAAMFIITLHLEHIDMGKLIANLGSFSAVERGKHFLLKLIAVPDNMPQALEAKRALDEAGIGNYRVQHVLDFAAGVISPAYTRDQLDRIAALRAERPAEKYMQLFNEYADGTGRVTKAFTYAEGVEQGLLRYKGMYCAAGYASFCVDAFGKIRKTRFCDTRRRATAGKNPFLDPGFITPARCRAPHCTCIPYTRLPKWRNPADAPAYLNGLSQD